jgi:hypothetical protein
MIFSPFTLAQNAQLSSADIRYTRSILETSDIATLDGAFSISTIHSTITSSNWEADNCNVV